MAEQRKPAKKSRAHNLAHWMDDRFTIPGTNIRFGLDPVLSLLPGVGDIASGLISSYFLVLGVQQNLPAAVILRMGLNILLDMIVGALPLLGDIFDVGWKANTKNAELLEKYSKDASGTEKKSKAVLWVAALASITIVIAAIWAVGWAVVQLLEFIF